MDRKTNEQWLTKHATLEILIHMAIRDPWLVLGAWRTVRERAVRNERSGHPHNAAVAHHAAVMLRDAIRTAQKCRRGRKAQSAKARAA